MDRPLLNHRKSRRPRQEQTAGAKSGRRITAILSLFQTQRHKARVAVGGDHQ
jgi:hypothetical protein